MVCTIICVSPLHIEIPKLHDSHVSIGMRLSRPLSGTLCHFYDISLQRRFSKSFVYTSRLGCIQDIPHKLQLRSSIQTHYCYLSIFTVRATNTEKLFIRNFTFYIHCFGLCHIIQTIPKVCIIKTISFNPMITIKRVNAQTISVDYFISQPVYDSVNYRSNYKQYGN